MKHYLIRILIAANQLTSTLLGGNPQMSLSARAGYAREAGSHLGTMWCGALDAGHHHSEGDDHCTVAMRHYRVRWEALHGAQQATK